MKISTKILIGLIFIAIGLFCIAFLGSADTLYSQTSDNANTSSITFGGLIASQYLGTGLSGTIEKVTIKGGDSTTNLVLYQCDSAPTNPWDYCTGGGAWVGLDSDGYPGFNGTLECANGFCTGYPYNIEAPEFDNTKYYWLVAYKLGGQGSTTVRGTTSNLYANGQCYDDNSSGTCGNSINDLWFTINSPESCTGTGCETTRIEWVYPFEGEETASRNIDFELTYYFNSTTDDATKFTQILILACSLINVSPFNQNLNDCEQLHFETEILNYDATITETVELGDSDVNINYDECFQLGQFQRASRLAENFKFYRAKLVMWKYEPIYNLYGEAGGETIPLAYIVMNRTQEKQEYTIDNYLEMGVIPKKFNSPLVLKYKPNWCSPGLIAQSKDISGNVRDIIQQGVQKCFNWLMTPVDSLSAFRKSALIETNGLETLGYKQAENPAAQVIYNGHNIRFEQLIEGTDTTVARNTVTVVWEFKGPKTRPVSVNNDNPVVE